MSRRSRRILPTNSLSNDALWPLQFEPQLVEQFADTVVQQIAEPGAVIFREIIADAVEVIMEGSGIQIRLFGQLPQGYNFDGGGKEHVQMYMYICILSMAENPGTAC